VRRRATSVLPSREISPSHFHAPPRRSTSPVVVLSRYFAAYSK